MKFLTQYPLRVLSVQVLGTVGKIKEKKKERTGASDLTGTAFCEPGELDPVHTRPEEFEDAALFLQLNLPSTLIRHENETFRFGESKNFLKTMTTR